MVPTSDAQGHIERIAASKGYATDLVRAAGLTDLPEGEKVEVLPGLTVINWPTEYPQPDLSGHPMDDLVLIKTAFEFMALMAGTAIYQDVPPLNNIRRTLRGSSDLSGLRIERLLSPNYAPFHGLHFEGNDPHSQVQIRLFGKLAFRVHFLGLALDGPKIRYTHDLKSGDHDVRIV
jgi:hypothetical protein